MFQRDRERGQLILVGGVALALVFVALGVLLNSAAFTGAEAARDDTADANTALSVRDDAVEGLGGALFYANYYDYVDAETLSRTLRSDAAAWEKSLANSSAARRSMAGLNLTRVTNGTQIYQDSTRNFTDGNDGNDPDANWQLASDVTGVRRGMVNVRASSLQNLGVTDDHSDAFHIEFKTDQYLNPDTSDFYVVYFHEEDGDVQVSWHYDEDTTAEAPQTCDTDAEQVTVDLSAGEVMGADCSDLRTFTRFDDPYAIEFDNPDEVEGRYNFVVDGTVADGNVDTDYYNPQAIQPPHQVPAIYNASVEIDYRTATLGYAANLTLAPETTPRGTVFGVA